MAKNAQRRGPESPKAKFSVQQPPRTEDPDLAPAFAVSGVLAAARTLDDAAPAFLRVVCSSLGWDVGELWLVDPDERVARRDHFWASPSVDVPEGERRPRTMVLTHGEGAPMPSDGPCWVADVAVPGFGSREAGARRVGLHGMVHLPIAVRGRTRLLLRTFSVAVRQREDGTLVQMATAGALLSEFLERGSGSGASPGEDHARCRAQMRILAGSLLLAEERERRQLGCDLHDGLGQLVALAQIKVAGMRSTAGATEGRTLDEIEDLLSEIHDAARTIGFELSPPVLHDLGLTPALEWLIENIRHRYGLAVVLEDDGLPKPADGDTRIILFRAIRELLINASKHAGVRSARLCLRREVDGLEAVVADDGVGMDPIQAFGRGFGLLSIQERLGHVGGSMRIESSLAGGTKVHLFAPLTENATTGNGTEA